MDTVKAGAAVEAICAGAAIEVIVARASDQRVISGAPMDIVMAVLAIEVVVAGVSGDGVTSTAAMDTLYAGEGIAGGLARGCARIGHVYGKPRCAGVVDAVETRATVEMIRATASV